MSGALTEATLPVVKSRTCTAPGTRAETASNGLAADEGGSVEIDIGV